MLAPPSHAARYPIHSSVNLCVPLRSILLQTSSPPLHFYGSFASTVSCFTALLASRRISFSSCLKQPRDLPSSLPVLPLTALVLHHPFHLTAVHQDSRGVRWVNDSKATNVEATAVGLRGLSAAAPHLSAVVLLGGKGKARPDPTTTHSILAKQSEFFFTVKCFSSGGLNKDLNGWSLPSLVLPLLPHVVCILACPAAQEHTAIGRPCTAWLWSPGSATSFSSCCRHGGLCLFSLPLPTPFSASTSLLFPHQSPLCLFSSSSAWHLEHS